MNMNEETIVVGTLEQQNGTDIDWKQEMRRKKHVLLWELSTNGETDYEMRVAIISTGWGHDLHLRHDIGSFAWVIV